MNVSRKDNELKFILKKTNIMTSYKYQDINYFFPNKFCLFLFRYHFLKGQGMI